MQFQRTVLDNGLEIVAETNEAVLSTSLGFFVRTGGRDETNEISGVSHFLEHMVFKGTDRRTAADVNRELDELGGDSNACTTEEMTAFYAKVLPELQASAIDLIGDILRPALRKEDFDMEKQVVLEEINMYEDQPPYLIDERAREFFFAGHPLAKSVLGTRESVYGITPEMMREYFQRRYSPSNVVFVASGAVEFDKLVNWVNAACGKWIPYEANRELHRPNVHSGTRVFTREDSSQEYVLQLVDAPSAKEDDRFAAVLLTMILGSSTGSRFFWELVDTGLAESASLSNASFCDGGFFETSLCCNPEDTDENLAIIRGILEDAQKSGVTEEELTRAKNKLLTAVALSAERPMSRLFAIGEEWLTNGKYYSVADELKIIREITLDQVNGLMSKYSFANPYTVAVGNLDSLRDY